MNNMLKAVLLICLTALIMFVLYFTVFNEQLKCEKAMWDRYPSTITDATATLRCMKILNPK